MHAKSEPSINVNIILNYWVFSPAAQLDLKC